MSEFDEWWAEHTVKDCTVWLLTCAAMAGVVAWLSIVENDPDLLIAVWILLVGVLQPLARAGQYRYNLERGVMEERP